MEFLNDLEMTTDLANCLTCVRKRARVTTELQRIVLELTSLL